MTREEILRMARQAGLEIVHFTSTPESIERFAALVAAAEREACANVVEQTGIEGHGTLAAAVMIRARGRE